MALNTTTAGLALVAFGTLQLAASLCCTRTIIRELPGKRASWRVLSVLILLFIAGYAAFAVYLARAPESPFMLLVATIFGAGGTFVFIVSRLSRTSIDEARRLSRLEDENARIDEARRRLQTVFDSAAEGIVTFDERGIVESCNLATGALFGLEPDAITGQPVTRFVEAPSDGPVRSLQPDEALNHRIAERVGKEFEMVGLHAGGRRFAMSVRLSRILIDGRELYTALVSDISERTSLLNRLQFLAERDTTTQLYNRSYFQAQLDVALARCDAERPLNLLYLDLDNFKLVNDLLGHAAGDRLLVEVADLLQGHFPENCVMARFGGDEFTALVPDMEHDAAVALAEALREKFDAYQFQRDGKRIDIGCSIGIARLARTEGSRERLMAQADTACHLAKRAGRNRVRVYEPDEGASVEALSLDVGWSRRIKAAIETDRFVLHGQPILNVADGSVERHEVLLRMLDEDDGLIMPSAFLPAAERLGLARDIDMWVIGKAIDLLVRRRTVDAGSRFALNLSAQALGDDTVGDFIETRVRESGVDPSALMFEVTETSAIADMQAAERLLGRLRAAGCHTALDGFGAGFGSFGHLRDLPVDTVKIDGRFVRSMAGNAVDVSIVRAINEVAHANGMRTVAAFVEDADGLALLRTIGVDCAQGYYTGRPEPLCERGEDGSRRAA